MRSSVESSASRRGSRAINLATQSSARNASASDQCSAAVNRRFVNAAARQGGTAVQGANARFSARKSRSLVDGDGDGGGDDDAVSVGAGAGTGTVPAALLLGVGRVEVEVEVEEGDAASSVGAKERV